MSILVAIIVGLVAGALAKYLLPGKDPEGLIITILLGVGGSVLASFVCREMGWTQGGGWLAVIGFATLGAVALLLGYRVIRRVAG